jgi:hypothetical protein
MQEEQKIKDLMFNHFFQSFFNFFFSDSHIFKTKFKMSVKFHPNKTEIEILNEIFII